MFFSPKKGLEWLPSNCFSGNVHIPSVTKRYKQTTVALIYFTQRNVVGDGQGRTCYYEEGATGVGKKIGSNMWQDRKQKNKNKWCKKSLKEKYENQKKKKKVSGTLTTQKTSLEVCDQILGGKCRLWHILHKKLMIKASIEHVNPRNIGASTARSRNNFRCPRAGICIFNKCFY